jgi:hypothetical protein
MPDYTPLPHKLEAAFVTYLASILDDMSLDGLQVIAAHQSAVNLATPRLVVECTSTTPRMIALPGWMDCEVSIHYITQEGDQTAEQHKTTAGTILSWLLDIATVQAALDATADLSVLHYQWLSAQIEAAADDGTRTTDMRFTLIAAGA